MSRLRRLIEAYDNYISLPWQGDAAAAQRVIFCIYNEREELRIRAAIEEFALATTKAGCRWELFDLTHAFPAWMATEEYAESYFQEPEYLADLLPDEFLAFLTSEFTRFLDERQPDSQSVVALLGAGTLFGFVKVHMVLDLFAPLVKGRLLVFFPGNYDNNSYRLLDGYDGWNYLAVPITADRD